MSWNSRLNVHLVIKPLDKWPCAFFNQYPDVKYYESFHGYTAWIHAFTGSLSADFTWKQPKKKLTEWLPRPSSKAPIGLYFGASTSSLTTECFRVIPLACRHLHNFTRRKTYCENKDVYRQLTLRSCSWCHRSLLRRWISQGWCSAKKWNPTSLSITLSSYCAPRPFLVLIIRGRLCHVLLFITAASVPVPLP